MAELIRVGLVIDDGGNAGVVDRNVQGLNRLGLAAEGGTRGINKIERALSTMAFQAAGIPGPMGQLSTTLLQFGIGGPVTLAFVAGFAAMSVAMKTLGLAAEESEERIGKLLEEAQKLGRAPDADLLVQQLGLQTTINLSRKALGPNATRSDVQALGFASGMLDEGRRGVIAARLATAEAGLITVTNELTLVRQAQVSMASGGTRGGITATDWVRLGIPGLAGGMQGRFSDTGPGPFARFGAFAPRVAGTGPDNFLGNAFARDLAQVDTSLPAEFWAKVPHPGLARGLGVAAGGLGMLAGVAGRGNAGGSFLQGAGGLLGSIPGGQVAGGVVGILGGIVSLFGHKESAEEKQLKELEKVNASLREQLEFARREELRQLTIRVRPGALEDPRSVDALARLQRDAKDRKVTVDFG